LRHLAVAPPYYSQRAGFASLWALFLIAKCRRRRAVVRQWLIDGKEVRSMRVRRWQSVAAVRNHPRSITRDCRCMSDTLQTDLFTVHRTYTINDRMHISACRQEITVFDSMRNTFSCQTSAPTLVYTLIFIHVWRVSILTLDIDCPSSPSIVSKLLYSKSFFTIILITLSFAVYRQNDTT